MTYRESIHEAYRLLREHNHAIPDGHLDRIKTDLLKTTKKTPMSEQEFKAQFVATFLASWCAKNYEEYCAYGRQEELSLPPAEDAEFLAGEAWNEYLSKCGK